MNYNTILPPFKWFVLENFPYIEDDFDALTNWQLFCKLGKEMNKIVEKCNLTGQQVENLTNAYNSLKAYVDNYFDNLDVQEEINTKLDEMAESGQLTDIIAQYLQLAGVLAYDTKVVMKTAENLTEGSICRTLGNNEYNDGYGAFYKVREIKNTDVVDDYNIVALLDENLVAERIISQAEKDVVEIKGELKEKVNKYVPQFIANNDNYYIRIGTKEADKHYVQFSTDLINWYTICDLPYDIFMQPTTYHNSYDLSCFIYNNEFYILYDYVDEDYNDWDQLDDTKFLFSNRIGVTKTSDFKTWTKYAIETPTVYKQIANPRLFIENDDLYLTLVGNDGTLTSDQSAYYHFPLICQLNNNVTATSNYMKLINSSENIIDPYIFKNGDYYYLFVSNETPNRTLSVYKGSAINTQFTTVVDTIDYKWNTGNYTTIEGPSLVKKDNLYYLFMDSVDHMNVINVTTNIESWNNCFFASTDNKMGNAQIYEINDNTKKALMLKFYEENDYPIFNKFPELKGYDYNYLNQTKKTIEFFPIANKTFYVYTGQWVLDVNKGIMPRDNDYCVVVNNSGSSNNVKITSLYGANTSWYLPIGESVVLSRGNILSNGKEYYSRKGHINVTSITANTKKTFSLDIPGITYSKVRSIQFTPFTSGSNTKQVFVYVDSVSDGNITGSILSNESIGSMEVYWSIDIQ